MARRRKKRSGKTFPFILLHLWILDTDAYRDLGVGARALLIEVWRKHTGFNNGDIALSVREAAHRLGANKDSVTRWFAELVEHGFLVRTMKGGLLGITPAHDGTADVVNGRASTWRITALDSCTDQPPSREFVRWKAGIGIQKAVPFMRPDRPKFPDGMGPHVPQPKLHRPSG